MFHWRNQIIIDLGRMEFMIADTPYEGDMYGKLSVELYGIGAKFTDGWTHKNTGFNSNNDPVQAIIDLLDYSGRWRPPKPRPPDYRERFHAN